jgi:hypothetical protein
VRIFDTPVVTGSTALARYTVAHTDATALGEHRGPPLIDFFRHGELRHGGRPIRRGRPPVSGEPETAILRIARQANLPTLPA